MFDALSAVQDPDGTPDGDATVSIVRESHFLCGWVEWIAIHESDSVALETADKIAAGLEDYPVIDEELVSQLEETDCIEVWSAMTEKERAEYIRSHVRTVYTQPGDSVYSTLRRAVKGEWFDAATILPCPSDLLSC
jgi:hypothetical protein